MRFLKFAGDEKFSGPDGSWVIPPLVSPNRQQGGGDNLRNSVDVYDFLHS